MTVGGVICGYCCTGSEKMAIAPAIEMTIEMTIASRVRVMKRSEIMIPPPTGWPSLGCTVMPSARRWIPWTTTCSPPFKPVVTAQPLPTRAPVSMRRCETVLSLPSR